MKIEIGEIKAFYYYTQKLTNVNNIKNINKMLK
jgi:hypothetical protein